jgi:hypothetical protein
MTYDTVEGEFSGKCNANCEGFQVKMSSRDGLELNEASRDGNNRLALNEGLGIG